MSVWWQEWQVQGIITVTWKVCVSTFGHLRRIEPPHAAAGLMSTVSPASNEEREIATVFHQLPAPAAQHPIMPWTRCVSEWTAAADVLSHINGSGSKGNLPKCLRAAGRRMWPCSFLGWLDVYPRFYTCQQAPVTARRQKQGTSLSLGGKYPRCDGFSSVGRTCYIYWRSPTVLSTLRNLPHSWRLTFGLCSPGSLSSILACVVLFWDTGKELAPVRQLRNDSPPHTGCRCPCYVHLLKGHVFTRVSSNREHLSLDRLALDSATIDSLQIWDFCHSMIITL